MSDPVLGIGEAAKLCGLSPRALRWWEAKGLLKPLRDPSNGRRRYGRLQLLCLQQVMALKSLGLTLSEISGFIHAPNANPAAVLEAQRDALMQERDRIDRALTVLDAAMCNQAAGHEPSVADLAALIRITSMSEWTSEKAKALANQYYTKEQMAAFEARGWSEADQHKANADWAALIARAERLMQIGDPASEAAQQLVMDWKAQIAQFTQGDAAVEANLGKMWKDADNWPEDMQSPISPEVMDFVGKAVMAG